MHLLIGLASSITPRTKRSYKSVNVQTKQSCVILAVCVVYFATNAVAGCRGIRSYDFSNVTYEVRSEGLLRSEPSRFRARLQNGSYEDPHEDDFLAFIYARIRSVRFGDLTKDGQEEAVVAIEYGSNSASFFLTNYFVFGCIKERIRLIGSIEQDQLQSQTSEILHESIREPVYIADGLLHFRHNAGGSRPSPIYVTTFRYQVSDGKLLPYRRPLYKTNSFQP